MDRNKKASSSEEYKVDFYTGQIQYTSIGTKSPTRASKSNIPFPSTPFSATVGDEGNSAIIGFNQDLIQFSSYLNQSFIFARGYSPVTQDNLLRSFLAQAQNDDDRNDCGWGLHLQESRGPFTKQFTRTAVERGFIDTRWPTQTDVIDGITKKAISYITNGKLIQAIAIGSRTRTSIDWKIGGFVQLGEQESMESQVFENYGQDNSVQTSPDGYILSATYKSKYCLDIQLFNNGLPVSLNNLVPEQQEMVFQDEIADYVDIRRKGNVQLEGMKPRIFLAVFSLRDIDQNQRPTHFDCPKLNEIRYRMLLPGGVGSLLTPIKKNPKMDLFSGSADMIERNAMQLLYTNTLPSRPVPINGFIECGPESIDYEATFWHIRFLKLFLPQAPAHETGAISETIKRNIKVLFVQQSHSLSCRNQAYRILTLFYALQDKNKRWNLEFLSKDTFEEFKLKLRPQNSDIERVYDSKDPVDCLLLWYHQWATFPDHEGLPKASDGLLERALDTSKLSTPREEEIWNQLALLFVELLGSHKEIESDNMSIARRLITLVASQLKKQKLRISWGYRCLNHSQRIDLAVAQSKFSDSSDISEILEDAYLDTLYFLRSDHSFARSLDTSDPNWLYDQWNLECSSIVCSSFLAIGDSDRHITTGDNTRHHVSETWTSANVEEVLELLRDIAKPVRHENLVPWRENVRVGYPYYPPFMHVSFATREASRDRVRLTEKLKMLSGPNKTAQISKLFSKLEISLPIEWSLGNLDFSFDKMAICDFSHNPSLPSVDITPELLAENRIRGHAAYRMIIVDTFTNRNTQTVDSSLFNVYLHFAHPDAWDNVVDFYSSIPVFRGSPQGRESSAVAEEKTWNTSISLPHFSLEEPNEIDTLGDFPRGCFSICVTGDKLGEFWTCSILGKTTTSQIDGTGTSGLLLNINTKTSMTIPVLENAEDDRYSARNLIFILHLTDINQNICDHYEQCLSKLEGIMDIKKSKKLSRLIAEKGLDESSKSMAELTNALNKALWGVEWLENFDRTLQLTKTEIQIAVAYVEENLSKRRRYWPERLEESEEIIWTKYKVSFARIQAFNNQIGSIIHEATGVKDNLILLSQMNSIQATLTTTKATLSTVEITLETAKDTSNMKIISILSMFFLPFTFFAVLLTTPMFKWPEPSHSTIIVKLPFILYLVLSTTFALFLGIPFYFTMWRDRKGPQDQEQGAKGTISKDALSRHSFSEMK